MIYGDVMQIKITKTAFKDMKKLDSQTRDRILRGINKLPIGDVKRLHNLIDMLNETDMETIYNVLMRFVPGDTVLEDEAEAIEQAEKDIANGDVINLADVVWE